MLKIYNAFGKNGNVELQKGITFECGDFDTGSLGFGTVRTSDFDCEEAIYSLHDLDSYLRHLGSIETKDGYVRYGEFTIFNPHDEQSLNEYIKHKIPKNSESFDRYCLNEEAVLLFTKWVNSKWDYNSDLVKRFFGRHPETSFFVLLPGAQMQMGVPSSDELDSYEVLQSRGLGKQLSLTKLDRNI